MTLFVFVAAVAAVTSWGLYRLQKWAQSALTIVATLPLPFLLYFWLSPYRGAESGVQVSIDQDSLNALSIVSALSCPPLLFLMWSPKGKTVFSPAYREIFRRTPGLGPGCWGFLPVIVTVPAVLFSHLALWMAVGMTLEMLGLIRST